jgi:hypothetical protein
MNSNPNFTAFKEKEEKHLEKVYNTRTKWNRCERSWIKQGRIYCRKLFGFKFSLDRFYELIIKLHSVFKGIVGIFKDKLLVNWVERWEFS